MDFLPDPTSDSGKNKKASPLLIPMKQEGIEVKPIITLGGSHSVNMVHFTDVKVPVENRVGDEGKGWGYAKGLLAHERTGLAGISKSLVALTSAPAGRRGKAGQRNPIRRSCLQIQAGRAGDRPACNRVY